MKDILTRTWLDLVGRVDGAMTFRLIVQPFVAARHDSDDRTTGLATIG